LTVGWTISARLQAGAKEEEEENPFSPILSVCFNLKKEKLRLQWLI